MASIEETHDLRTALAIVRGGADLLARHGSLPPERWELACDLVVQGLERLRACGPEAIELDLSEDA
ncbi:MAG: hypothetical protein ACLGHL_06635 [Actinomycetota bacterium]